MSRLGTVLKDKVAVEPPCSKASDFITGQTTMVD